MFNQLDKIGITLCNKDIIALILNNLSKSCSTFKLIQKDKLTLHTFLKLRGLFLQEKNYFHLEKSRDNKNEVLYAKEISCDIVARRQSYNQNFRGYFFGHHFQKKGYNPYPFFGPLLLDLLY